MPASAENQHSIVHFMSARAVQFSPKKTSQKGIKLPSYQALALAYNIYSRSIHAKLLSVSFFCGNLIFRSSTITKNYAIIPTQALTLAVTRLSTVNGAVVFSTGGLSEYTKNQSSFPNIPTANGISSKANTQ